MGGHRAMAAKSLAKTSLVSSPRENVYEYVQPAKGEERTVHSASSLSTSRRPVARLPKVAKTARLKALSPSPLTRAPRRVLSPSSMRYKSGNKGSSLFRGR